MKGIRVMFVLMVTVVMGSCVTQQQRAEEKARMQEMVVEAVAKKQWRIDVTSMSTLRYGSRTVTPDFYLELRGDTLQSYLPYLGQAHQAPMASPSQGLNFKAPIIKYEERKPRAHLSQIDIDVKTQEDTYHYHVELYDTGQAYIQVRSQHRDPISFDGRM